MAADITYRVHDLTGITPPMLTGFFEGWPNPPSPEVHLEILRGSYRVVLAVDTSRNKVAGFITAISDGVLAAYIPLLEVQPSYRGTGIGKQLTLRLINELKHLYMVDLLCDPALQAYYQKLGMTNASGMMVRNYENQSGQSSFGYLNPEGSQLRPCR